MSVGRCLLECCLSFQVAREKKLLSEALSCTRGTLKSLNKLLSYSPNYLFISVVVLWLDKTVHDFILL